MSIIPKVYFNKREEDINALSDLADAGINFDMIGPIGDYKTPMLLYGNDKYVGRSSIRLFISRYEKENSE